MPRSGTTKHLKKVNAGALPAIQPFPHSQAQVCSYKGQHNCALDVLKCTASLRLWATQAQVAPGTGSFVCQDLQERTMLHSWGRSNGNQIIRNLHDVQLFFTILECADSGPLGCLSASPAGCASGRLPPPGPCDAGAPPQYDAGAQSGLNCFDTPGFPLRFKVTEYEHNMVVSLPLSRPYSYML